MPDTEPDGTETDGAAPSNAELEQRVSGVESKLDLILEKLSGSGVSPAKGDDKPDPEGTGSIAEQIRAQLAERDKQTADKASKDAAEQRIKTVEDRLDGMSEATPQPPERRLERLMWGSR
jgi:hypothetical protein